MNLLFSTAIDAAINAGKAIMEVYSTDFDVEFKQDSSPLTLADQNANKIIEEHLKKTDLPILSEEGREIEFEERKNWTDYWIVDPLDGTKEFVKKNGEFTVNIALMRDNEPIFGVIYAPSTETLYFGGKDHGSFMTESIAEMQSDFNGYISSSDKMPRKKENEVYRMIGSRSHMSEETEEYFKKREAEKGKIDVMSKGSSLKLCMVAEGEADEYPRFAPTMEWDIAAGHAILEGAGKELIHFKSGERMRYNRKNLVNSWFVARNK